MKHKKRVRRTPRYEEQFDIDISQENMGQVFEVITYDGDKYKVEVIDPKKQIVRATNLVSKAVAEGLITIGQGKPSRLTPYTSLPAPKGHKFSIIIEKLRRL